MKRIYSLKGRNLFREVYQKGRKLRGSGIRLFILRLPDEKSATMNGRGSGRGAKRRVKFAFALAKTYGRAHIRNRAKRRMRAICTGLLPDLKDGFCIIIRLDREYRNLAYEEEEKIIKGIFARAGLLHGNAYKNVQHDNQ